MDEDKSDVEEVLIPIAEPVKIKKDYKIHTPAFSEPKQRCPRCGQEIPASEMDEHVRIELLDPKWKQQKDKTSNLETGNDVARHLKNLSGFRSDIFGASDETNIGRKVYVFAYSLD